MFEEEVEFRSDPESLEEVARKFGGYFKHFIMRMARSMYVPEQWEDLAQDFWARVTKEWEKVVKADRPFNYMCRMAANVVISAVHPDKRVYVQFVLDANPNAVLEALGLAKKFKRLKKPWKNGLPVYSGRVKHKSVLDLHEHADVAFVKTRSDFERIDKVVFQNHSELAIVHCVLDRLPDDLKEHVKVLRLHIEDELSFSEISVAIGKSVTTCRKYYNQIVEILKNSPELKELWAS